MNGTCNKVMISMWLDKELSDELKSTANNECRSISAEVRYIITKYLEEVKMYDKVRNNTQSIE